MALTVASATLADDADFARFACWNQSDVEPWAEEVENYIRGTLLHQANNYTLTFRAEDQLVAVASFYKSTIGLPLAYPADHPSWHLDVVAVTLQHQGSGHSLEVYQKTLQAMRDIDPDPILLTAFTHVDNHAAIESAKQIGLTPLCPRDDIYWILLGELVP
jgi:RimJ/RimL family protein N-acetyltransferase